MKKIIISILMFISLMIPYNVYALSTTDAKEKIDVDKNSSLTINYLYDDYNFDNVEVKIYHVATITSNFQYNLSSNFEVYPIEINGLKNDSEWNSIEQTLNAYIEADSISEFTTQKIENNTIILSNLKAGLYFVKTEKIDTKDYTLIFDNFLISVPDLQEDGTWNYDVSVFPKAETYIQKYEKITYTVTKNWVDDKQKRPNSVEIEIYEDSKLVDTKVLSSKNNWTYNWTTDDDGSVWNVVERNVPEGYNVTITKNNNNFTVVNTDPNYKPYNPLTYDNIKSSFIIMFASLIGLVLLVIGIKVPKKNK